IVSFHCDRIQGPRDTCHKKGKLMKPIRILITAAIALLLNPIAFASGPHGTQAGWAIDDSGNVLITDAVADRMAQSGAGWIWLHFRRGPYSGDTTDFYAKYDEIVNRLRAR